MIFDILMSVAVAYLCYKAVLYRRRKTKEFMEKRRDKSKTKPR